MENKLKLSFLDLAFLFCTYKQGEIILLLIKEFNGYVTIATSWVLFPY